MYKKNFEEKNLVPWDLPGVPRVPISGPNRGIFSKLIGPGPLGSGGHSHTSFSNGRFRDTYTSFHIDVQRKFKNERHLTLKKCTKNLFQRGSASIFMMGP